MSEYYCNGEVLLRHLLGTALKDCSCINLKVKLKLSKEIFVSVLVCFKLCCCQECY